MKQEMAAAGIEEFGGFLIEEIATDFAKAIDANSYIYKLTRRNQL